jgi:hypothetical protein
VPYPALGCAIPARVCSAAQDVSITVRHHGDAPSDFEALLVVDLLESRDLRRPFLDFVGEVVMAYLQTPEGQWATLDDVLCLVREIFPAWATLREDVARIVDLHRSP